MAIFSRPCSKIRMALRLDTPQTQDGREMFTGTLSQVSRVGVQPGHSGLPRRNPLLLACDFATQGL
eukprot:5343126-Pyramimonas_sp.AAC.1